MTESDSTARPPGPGGPSAREVDDPHLSQSGPEVAGETARGTADGQGAAPAPTAAGDSAVPGDGPARLDSARPPSTSVDLVKSQPALEGEIAPVEASPVPASRTRRVLAAGATARDRGLQQLVALLVPLIRATRYPTLAVVLVAAVPAVAAVVISQLRWGPDDPFWLLLGGIGLVLAGWLGLRRRQLLAVAKDPAALTDALAGVITGREMWDQLVRNVSAGKIGAKVVRRSRPLRILGGLWRGVQMTGVLAQITDRPELQPLLPGRLRGMWFLGIACLIAGVVLSAAVLVEVLLYLLGA